MAVKSAEKIERMFSDIAPTYDFLNRLLSAGIDKSWRKKAVESLAPKKGLYLDVATGTADLALEIFRQNQEARIVGADLSMEMLKIGKKKTNGKKIGLWKGDALNLFFKESVFDGVVCAFGIRNFADLEGGLKEMHRVLKPGGRIALLEFAVPANKVFKTVYLLYFKYILPAVGRLVSGHSEAYSYLHSSTADFPAGDELKLIFKTAGFDDVAFRPLTFGICDLITGCKPG